MRQCFYTLLAVFLLSPVFSVSAQTSCGNVIIPTDFYYPGFEADIQPITNCANPLNADTSVSFTTTFSIAGQPVTDGAVITVPASATTSDVQFTMDRKSFVSPLNIYSHNDQDYQLVYQTDGNVIDPTPAPLAPGHYTAAFVYMDAPVFNQASPSLFERIRNIIIPTAFAYYADFQEVIVVNFEIKATPQTPAGASSVLFLPGIMGSRLYEQTSACIGDGTGPVKEQEWWFSLNTCGQLRLIMDTNGISSNDIYTKSGESSVIASQSGSYIYKTLFDNLAVLKEKQIIKNYVAVPYDWRLGLDALLKVTLNEQTGKLNFDPSSTIQNGYLYKTLSKLAEDSKSGKVTIIAHSNGGLLAKALLASLQKMNDPLVDKIDVVMLIAVPQAGTPDALVSILHGSRIIPFFFNLDEVVSQQTTRQLLGTMPFAYHLLPHEVYFNGQDSAVTTPVITFEPGSITTPWATRFGSTITTTQKMQDFMRTESGRTMPAVTNLNDPAVVSGYLFNYSNSIDLLVDNWKPASSTKVYEIAGVGVQTAAGITYFSDTECRIYNIKCLLLGPKLSYRVNQTIDGDGTVLTPSALAISTSSSNVERWWLNLFEYNSKNNSQRDHSSIFEVPEIVNFIKNTLQSSTTATYSYLSLSAPVISDSARLNFYLHSPLDMTLSFANGITISSSSPAIGGAIYRRYGELQYISVPDTNESKILRLNGVASGSFTLEVEQQIGDTKKRQTYPAIPSSTTTKVTTVFTDSGSLPSAVLAIDYDGNGSVDTNYIAGGTEISWTVLTTTVNNLLLPPLSKKLILETIKVLEKSNQQSLTKSAYKIIARVTLEALKEQINLSVKIKLMTVSDQQKILTMVNILLNK